MEFLKQFFLAHPRLSSWIILALGMEAVLLWSARDVGLPLAGWVTLTLATLGVAALAVWIIHWEEDDAPSDEA